MDPKYAVFWYQFLLVLLIDSVIKIFNKLEVPVVWDIIDRFSFDDPSCLEMLHKNKTILKGPMSNKRDSQQADNMKFAKELELFTLLSHCFTLPGITTRHGNFDVVVLR